ncbi:hypothetical protein IFM89_032118 [Coptis chinensis]|uniref:Protein FAR1-RELATED SEQUENCE n=1 Tax=Coptis chinensis TaxID=261450 RepID=A0A835M7G8_9MAGN|nr:hypothetical protein IFM89_032118 [Coptis chinensis]
MEDVEGEDCEVLHYTLGSENNISNVELKPTLGMKFSSFEDAKDFYIRHAMQKRFGTKIKNLYNKKNTDQNQFTQFSCSKERFKVEKEGVLYKRPNSRDLKRKLVDESNNSYSVEDELVGTLPSESPESVQPGYVKFLNPLQAKLVGRLKGRLLSELEKNWKSTTKKQKVLPTVTTVPKSGNHKATNKNISCHDTCGNEHNITSNQFQENMSMDDTFGGSANKFFDNNNVLGLRSGYEDGTFASYPPGFFTSQLLEPRQLNNASGQHHFPQLFLPEQCSQAPHAFPSTNNDGAIPLSSQFDLNKSQWVSSDN